MSKTVLTLDEINLLKNSEEIKNIKLYGNLFSVLKNLHNPKALSLEQLPNLDDKARAALTYNKKTMIDTVIKEWYAERVSEEDPSKKVRCGLCNTPNKYLYYIRNRKNELVLNVGSHCITKFPGIEGYIEQKQQMKLIHKSHLIISRRSEFYEKFPNCEEYILDAEGYFASLPILLPHNLYTKIQETISRMRIIFIKYVNEGKKPFNSELDSFQLFNLAVNQFKKLKSQSDIFISENVNNPLICKRKEMDWLIANNKQSLLQQISENNGCYNLATLKQMTSHTFILEYIESIAQNNKSTLFKISELRDNGIYITFYKIGYRTPILFKMSLQDFMTEIGSNYIMDNNFSYDINLYFKKMRIVYSLKNIESIIEYVFNTIHNFNCALLLNHKTNKLVLYRRPDKAIKYIGLQEFVGIYGKYINKPDDYVQKVLFTIVKSSASSWISLEKQIQLGINGEIYNLYKEQYLEIKDKYTHYNKNKYFEIVTYKVVYDKNKNVIIDFNNPEYLKISRRQIRLSDNTLSKIEYALYIQGDILYPLYSSGTMLFIQNQTSVKNGDSIFYTGTDNNLLFGNCWTKDEYENIYKHIPIPKKEVKLHGKIIYSFEPNFKED